MAKETTQVELSLEQVNRVWELWDIVGKVGRQRQISNATGLPLATVRAVTFGHYEVANGKAIVIVPAEADLKATVGSGLVAGWE